MQAVKRGCLTKCSYNGLSCTISPRARLTRTGAIAARPGGAFYGLVNIGDEAESALAFAKRVLVESGVAVVPGDTFGASTARMVRLAFTIDDAELRAGLERLRAFLRR